MWEKKILGDDNPESMLNTIIYMNGLYFALRSGQEHRNLRHNPCQIQVVERDHNYLVYTEDVSKNNPGSIKGRKLKPSIHHHANSNPDRCFVTKYISLCPPNRPDDAFYLAPLKEPRDRCWYSNVPVGRNKLAKTVADMCTSCGRKGFKTNHSLCATTATHLKSGRPAFDGTHWPSELGRCTLIQTHIE